MIKRIDPHEHLRGRKEDYKESFTHAIELAESQGIFTVFAMPNTIPPIVRRVDVEEYLKLVPKAYEGRVGVYMGVTADPSQLREAMDCFDDFDEVKGLKMFPGSSTGSLLVEKPEDQLRAYSTCHKGGYKGVFAVHGEDEDIIKRNKALWDPTRPITHGLARPKAAETTSIANQIFAANQAGFEGTLYICHVSCPESIDIINSAKRIGRKVVCEVTPHHILWNEKKLEHPDAGRIFKTNPPLRKEEDRKGVVEMVLQGMVDCVGSDHAPHAITDKMDEEKDPPSGFPSLIIHKKARDYLQRMGMKEEQIDAMTCGNIKRIFGRKVT